MSMQGSSAIKAGKSPVASKQCYKTDDKWEPTSLEQRDASSLTRMITKIERGGVFLGANLCQRNNRPNVDSSRKSGSCLVRFEWNIKKPSYARDIAAGIEWRNNLQFQETSYRLIRVRPPVFRFPYGLKETSESAATGGVN